MRNLLGTLKKLHSDERGAEGLEKLLIVAAIVLPLLGALIIFRDAVRDWVVRKWEQAVGKEGEEGSTYMDDLGGLPLPN